MAARCGHLRREREVFRLFFVARSPARFRRVGTVSRFRAGENCRERSTCLAFYRPIAANLVRVPPPPTCRQHTPMTFSRSRPPQPRRPRGRPRLFRAHARQDPPRISPASCRRTYQCPNLGGGFDERCVHFLGVSYPGSRRSHHRHRDASDDELFEWALNAGRHPDDEESRCGTSSCASAAGRTRSATPARRAQERSDGFGGRADIETMFQFIDADEGRF